MHLSLSVGHSLWYWSWFRGVVLVIVAVVGGDGGEFNRAVNLLLVETGVVFLLGRKKQNISRVVGCSLQPNFFLLAHLAATRNVLSSETDGLTGVASWMLDDPEEGSGGLRESGHSVGCGDMFRC